MLSQLWEAILAYTTNMKAAAYRHLQAGEALLATPRTDVAGYLFGIAAECGVKALMLMLGMTSADDRRSGDPFYAHFSELKTLILDSAEGRKHSDLRKFAENPAFMSQWDVTMRYSDGKGVDPRWVARWHQDAKDVIAEL